MQKLKAENNRRLEILFKQKGEWLHAVAFNLTKSKEDAKDLVSELFLYLSEKVNPKIWYGMDDFNMLYLYSFLKSRSINGHKAGSKTVLCEEMPIEVQNREEVVYDEERDAELESVYNAVCKEIEDLQKTRMWSSAKLAEIYFFTEGMTLDKLSKEIGISKSTSFLNVRKVKHHIRIKYSNPFGD